MSAYMLNISPSWNAETIAALINKELARDGKLIANGQVHVQLIKTDNKNIAQIPRTGPRSGATTCGNWQIFMNIHPGA